MSTSSESPAVTDVPDRTGGEGVEAGRGALFIGFAKIYFMISGSLQRVVLPHLIDAAGSPRSPSSPPRTTAAPRRSSAPACACSWCWARCWPRSSSWARR